MYIFLIVVLLLNICHAFAVESTHCRNGWLSYGNSCYLFSHDTLSWPEASQTCNTIHSDLAMILTAGEHNFLKTELKHLHLYDASEVLYWIDGTDLEVENEWRWATTEQILTYTDWGPAEPDNNKNQNCLCLWGAHDFKMCDHECEQREHYICQYRLDTGAEMFG